MKDIINIKGDNNIVNGGVTMQQTQSRWKSPVLWSSLVADLLGIFGLLGVYEFTGIKEDTIKALCIAVIGIASTLGIINNPSDKEKI